MVDNKEEFHKVVLKDKETRLNISRVPKKVKILFIQLAEEEFEKDYGMTLKWCLDQAIEYQNIKPLMFNLLPQKSQNDVEQEEGSIKTFSGRELKGGKKHNGSTR